MASTLIRLLPVQQHLLHTRKTREATSETKAQQDSCQLSVSRSQPPIDRAAQPAASVHTRTRGIASSARLSVALAALLISTPRLCSDETYVSAAWREVKFRLSVDTQLLEWALPRDQCIYDGEVVLVPLSLWHKTLPVLQRTWTPRRCGRTTVHALRGLRGWSMGAVAHIGC